MRKLHLKFTFLLITLLMASGAIALSQTTETAASSVAGPGVPRLVKVSGVLKDASEKLLTSTVGINFSVYAESTGGVPLWQETQNVVFSQGRYTVFLGASTGLGIPAELFASGQPRWLGMRILLPGEEEQPRTLLASVPYALKAVDADTLGGLPASAYLKAESVATTANESAAGSSIGVSGTSNGGETAQSKPLAVTTSGGKAGNIPIFSGNNPSKDIENSPIVDSSDDILIPRLNSVRYVGGGITVWPGSDIGEQINAAYADLPATGGTIVVLPNPIGGSYTFKTPIMLVKPDKTALITGIGPAGTPEVSMNQGTILEYTPTSATCAITLDYLDSSGAGYTRANGVRDIALWNNHSFMKGGTGSSATGVCEGTSNGGTGNADFSNVFIGGFGTGISLTNKAAAWGQTIRQSSLVYNNIGLATDGFIENINITDDVIAVNGTGIWATGDASNGYSNPEFNITGGSIDSNTVAGINYTQKPGGGTLTLNGVHFENAPPGPCTGSTGLPYIVGNPNLFIFGGVMMDDCSSASPDNSTGFISIGTDAVIVGTQLVSLGRTENEGVIQLTGSGVSRAFIVPYDQSPATLTQIVGGSQSGFATVFPVTPTSSMRTVTAAIAGNLAVNLDGSNAGGNLTVAGSLSVAGAKNFKIDHPLDPANKYLYHTSVESPDMMNIYNGVIKMNSRGEAWVQLPSYFQALNQGFRYQLTSLGKPQPQLYVAHEVSGNRFKIAGGVPWGKVSWQVTGIRHDAYAEAHRSPVEVDKPTEERGHYLHPELFSGPPAQVVQNGR